MKTVQARRQKIELRVACSYRGPPLATYVPRAVAAVRPVFVVLHVLLGVGGGSQIVGSQYRISPSMADKAEALS